MTALSTKNHNLAKKISHLEEVLATRLNKLEQIKPEIPLKTYHYLKEKLRLEQDFITQQSQKASEVAKSDAETQSLSKLYFEKHQLKPKLIRIE